MATVATQATLGIKAGDQLFIGVRRQSTSPQIVLSVSSSVSATTGANVYAVTTAQGVHNLTANTTVLESINSAGVAIYVTGQ